MSEHITNIRRNRIITLCEKRAKNDFQNDNGVRISKWGRKLADVDL